MTLTIDLTDEDEAILSAKALAAGMEVQGYARQVLERDLHSSPPGSAASEIPIWEVLLRHAQSVPIGDLEKLPEDGASQIDHYLYGHPKR